MSGTIKMWKDLNEFYAVVNWSFCFREKDIKVATFLVTLVLLMGMPKSSNKVSKSPQSWFTNDCKVAVRRKQKRGISFVISSKQSDLCESEKFL